MWTVSVYGPRYGIPDAGARSVRRRTCGGRLYLSGVDEEVGRQLRRAGKLDLDRAVHLVPADDIFGASTE